MAAVTDHSHRRQSWSDCLNARDLGGLPTVGGSLTTPGVFFRSDDLAWLDASGHAAFATTGIASVIDLRRPAEATATVRFYPFHPTSDPAYTHLPLIEDSAPAFATLEEFYAYIVTSRSSRLAQIFHLLATLPTPLVFHCLAGKDRTGIVAALLLALAGVPDQAIASDYALSDAYLQPLYARQLLQATQASEYQRLQSDSTAPPQRILATLEGLRQAFTSVEDYLLGAGLSTSDLESLRARLGRA